MSIKSARKRAGKTVKDVASVMGVSLAAVYQWESGVNRPDIDKLLSLAAFLDCQVEDLLRKDEPEADNAAK